MHTNEYMRAYREKNREKIREYNKEYNRVWRKKYGYMNETRWKKAHPLKVQAEKLLKSAVERGIVKRMPCEMCGENKSVAHHPNYRKALQVIFLCHLHHRQVHYRKRKVIHKNVIDIKINKE